MTASALLDTSFLITLINSNRENYEVSKQFYKYMLQNDMPMYFSSIVAAEFGIRQQISDLPLSNFRMLNFNILHGQKAAELWIALGTRDKNDSRATVRDDVKLLAQASHEKIEFLLTEDGNTLQKYSERLRQAGVITTRSLRLADGFDASFLREDGQKDWVANIEG